MIDKSININYGKYMRKSGKELRKEKQTAIFDSALKVIKEKGFHQARIADIAVEAKVSYGLVYHYFKNKEDLFNEILFHWWAGIQQCLNQIQSGPQDFTAKLKQLILFFLNTYQTKPDLVHVFITQISRSANNLTTIRLDTFKDFISSIETLLRQGQKCGALRVDIESHYLSYIFLGAVEAFLSVMVLGNEPIKKDRQKEKIANSIMEVFLNGAKDRTITQESTSSHKDKNIFCH